MKKDELEKLASQLDAHEDFRVARLARRDQITEDEARVRIVESDTSRRQFVEKLLHADVDDPCHYDLVLNAEKIHAEQLLGLALEALAAREALTARSAAAAGTGAGAPRADLAEA